MSMTRDRDLSLMGKPKPKRESDLLGIYSQRALLK